MGRLVVTEHVTLDGVMQAPGRADEDLRDGFDRGGWAQAGNDEVMGRVMGEGMSRGGAMVFGRRTYEDFAAFWPAQANNPFTAVLDKVDKYVASRTLREPLPWQNSTVLDGDAADAVARLKSSVDGDLSILGSGELVASLSARGLVDEYVLMIHPLVLGHGRRLFPGGSVPSQLRLLESIPTTTGVIIARYAAIAS